ncbi:amidohydrolase family protein [Pedococcus sp. NPDC057267]|uniref:amidohydrolase family protein n=1 Tax=Pedococcus sp. NPDC057267 TaxID=3346077 RepID=UPI00363CF841
MHAVRAPHAFDGERFLPGGATVLVDGDRIAAVEPFGHELPHDVVVEEHAGTVLPGLVDCHTHLVADGTVGGLERAGSLSGADVATVVLSSLRRHVGAGVTTVRDLGDVAYRTLAFREVDGLPRVVAAGPPVTTPGGHCHFLGGAVASAGDEDLRAAVDERVERGVDVVKVMASGGFATPGSDQLGVQFTAAQLAVLVDRGHRAGLPVVAHAHSLAAMQQAEVAGVDGIEHFTGLSRHLGARLDDRLLEDVARRGTYVDLTMGNDRSLHALMPAPPPYLATLMEGLGARTFDELYAARLGHLAQLREHGVRVVAGVDSGMVPPKQHGNVWRVVLEMLEAGYDIEAALAVATSVAASACSLDGVTGRLAPGLAADVLVVDGDLRSRPDALGRPRRVLVRGRAADAPQPT